MEEKSPIDQLKPGVMVERVLGHDPVTKRGSPGVRMSYDPASKVHTVWCDQCGKKLEEMGDELLQKIQSGRSVYPQCGDCLVLAAPGHVYVSGQYAATPPKPPRPSFEEIHMRMAGLVSGRSTCARLNVGCVIARSDFRAILAMGYNGNASGLPNHCDSEVPGKCGCIHAEQNAVINCDAPRHYEKIVFTTHLPCVMCAKFMVNLGNVKKVIYHTDYRIKDGLKVFDATGIEHEQYEVKW